MRLKHNKKRNTAFVYESLVRELTKSIIKKNKNRQNKILHIIKENFHPQTVLYKELALYKVLYESRNLPTTRAEKLLVEAKGRYKELDKKQVFHAQTSLINKINKTLSRDLYDNFVPSYRNLASLYSIFNVDMSPEEKVLLEEKVVEFMTAGSVDNDMIPMDNIIYNSFVEKFNKEYSESLMESQKNLLTAMISSVSGNDLEFKVYLNEEIGKIKDSLLESLTDKDVSEDTDMVEKTKKVIRKLESFGKRKIDSEMVTEILKIQELVGVLRDAS